MFNQYSTTQTTMGINAGGILALSSVLEMSEGIKQFSWKAGKQT